MDLKAKPSLQKTDVVKLLQSNRMDVVFRKTDGTMRKMHCTLMEDYLPEKSEETRSHTPNDEVVSVWDLEKQDWRAFRLDAVSEIRSVNINGN